MSSLDSSVTKNWLEATYLGGLMNVYIYMYIYNVFLDPGSIPASYVNAAWTASQGLLFQPLEKPKKIRYPT